MARCPFSEWIPSPNFSTRTRSVVGALQHSTVGAWAPSLDELTRPDTTPVSAHFLIGLDGRLAQLVDTDDVAWHGRSANEQWIGIEHVDDRDHADPVRTPEQYATSARLNLWLSDMYDYLPDATTIERHRTFVNTACPSGLDVERIIIETQGGDMADYIERAEYEQYQRNVGESFTAVKDFLHSHTHGKAALKLTLPSLATRRAPSREKKATRAQVRAGHGR